jgi:hypothetical protein
VPKKHRIVQLFPGHYTARRLATLPRERGASENRATRVRIMYWDVVEVTPKSDYGLFIRFKDGTEGI